MEPFAPQSWEMPPGARVLEESASVVAREFDGGTQQWIMAPIQMPFFQEPVLWMRRQDFDFDAGFFVYDAKYSYIAPFLPELNAHILDWVFKKANYKRQFILNAQGQLRQENEAAHEGLLVDCIGDGAWSLGTVRAESHDLSRFQWDARMTPAAFTQLPALEVWQKIEELSTEPNSDTVFARRFALMSESERHALIFKDASINKHEFGLALRAFVIAQDLWEQECYDGEILFVLYSDGTTYLGIDGDDSPILPQLELRMEALRQRFMPVNKEVENFLCVKDWLDNRPEIAEFVIAKPSAHEQLEAALRWRQWKGNHEKF